MESYSGSTQLLVFAQSAFKNDISVSNSYICEMNPGEHIKKKELSRGETKIISVYHGSIL